MTLHGIKSIDVDAVEWFDKVMGQSYHSSKITVEYHGGDKHIVHSAFEYGYGKQYEEAAFKELEDNDILWRDIHANGVQRPLWMRCQDDKIAYDHRIRSVFTKKECVTHGQGDET